MSIKPLFPLFLVCQTNQIITKATCSYAHNSNSPVDYYTIDCSRQRSSAAAGSPAAEQVSILADASAFHKPLTV